VVEAGAGFDPYNARLHYNACVEEAKLCDADALLDAERQQPRFDSGAPRFVKLNARACRRFTPEA
jgi:hypothetical protein